MFAGSRARTGASRSCASIPGTLGRDYQNRGSAWQAARNRWKPFTVEFERAGPITVRRSCCAARRPPPYVLDGPWDFDFGPAWVVLPASPSTPCAIGRSAARTASGITPGKPLIGGQSRSRARRHRKSVRLVQLNAATPKLAGVGHSSGMEWSHFCDCEKQFAERGKKGNVELA